MRAAALRRGGYIHNLRGVGYDTVEKMGLLTTLSELQYETDELRMDDGKGRTRGGYRAKVLQDLAHGRIASVARADVVAAIRGALDSRVEANFGDRATAIEDGGPWAQVCLPCRSRSTAGRWASASGRIPPVHLSGEMACV